jgi:hypothetical protein
MPQDQKNTTYLVTLDTGAEGAATYQVTAAHLKTDDHYFPGFVQLFDEDKNLVAIAGSARVLLICRREADPARMPRAATSAAPVPGPPRPAVPRPPHTPASRAQLAQLAGRGGKPGQV